MTVSLAYPSALQSRRRRITVSLGGAAMALACLATEASALKIELKDVAADRIERQRAAAAGALPLAGTPNIALLDERLRDAGVTRTAPMLIRLFKSESELEVWKQRDGEYVLFATYPICHWSGSLGPKLLQGDKQTPEGFYTVARAQTRGSGRWPRSLNIGYPNVFDQAQARTGSHILVHGGCSSIGCFAMTTPVMEEIYELTTAAIDAGQSHVPVHSFPFRMTPINILKNVQSPWLDAWKNLKQGYDLFEATRRPPKVSVCDGRYTFEKTAAGELPGDLNACPSTLLAIREQNLWLQSVPTPTSNDNARPSRGRRGASNRRAIPCNMKRPSCRKFVAMRQKSAPRVRTASRSARQRLRNFVAKPRYYRMTNHTGS